MIQFRHHSRLLSYRRPQGAAKCGDVVHIEADSPDASVCVSLRLYYEDGTERYLDMPRQDDRVSLSIALPTTPCLVWYSFRLITADGQTLFYGADGGEGALLRGEPRAYQITVYDGAFETPKHWREGVVYQIFPDRFKRSSWEDFRSRAQYHTSLGRFLRIHDRWSDEVCFMPSPGKTDYDPDDFFGGDVNGIIEKLDDLHSLGVTTIYCNPMFESASNHRYNTADYLKIDPILGGDDDFRALCEAAKARGMRVMLDGVFSHTGADSRYFDKDSRYADVGAFESEASPYRDWYSFSDDGKTYDCWWGFDSLPNVNETNPSYEAFILGETGVLCHWAERGTVDWRLDVADELPDSFIRKLRARVKQNDPSAVLLGEVWDDCSNKYGSSGRRGYVSGDELDSAMNYPFLDAVIAFLTGKSDAYAFYHTLALLREHYPRPFYEACLNLLSSHDTVRILTALAGAPDRRALSRERQRLYRPSEKDAALGKKRFALAVAAQVALPGVPCVYYGDEAGMTGMSDPFNRGTYPWGNEDAETMTIYKRLLGARRDTVALRRGLCRMGALSADAFAIARYLPDGSSCAVLLMNRSEREQTIRFAPNELGEGPDAEAPFVWPESFTEALTQARVERGNEENTWTRTLSPITAELWIGSSRRNSYV